MAGKVLKVVSNDLYGNVDDRILSIYACFKHIKYMNNYVVFTFNDGNQKKLCYGSVHLKKDSLVIFDVKSDVKKYIDEFLNEYLSDKLIEYELMDINNMKKVELVSYNDMEYDKIQELDNKSIKRETIKEEEVKGKKPVFLYILLIFLILIGGGLTVLYLKPELFTIKYKGLECTNNVYDNKVELNYQIDKTIKFDSSDKLESISVVRTYAFFDSNSYDNFKTNNNENLYFTNGESYKYFDDELKFKLFYEESSVIDDYDEMLTYLKKEGYNCVELEYEE